VLILLPPSETKTRPCPDADPLAPETLSFPSLREPRDVMLRAAAATATGKDGARKLGVPASAPELTDRMARIGQEPAGAPLDVYSGVLYDQLGSAIPGPDRRVLVQSALFGVVDAGTDAIPAYRLSAGSTVSRLGTPGAWWRTRLAPLAAALLDEVAASPSPFVLDCRSGSYRSMMRMRSSDTVRVLEVSPVREHDGRRTVVSHDAKRYRGLVTRALLEDRRPVPDARSLLALLSDALGGGTGIEIDGDRLVLVDRV
jgi:cytoplasmic iron level regulating protein YaaA (DUF328/UPF0246 family)